MKLSKKLVHVPTCSMNPEYYSLELRNPDPRVLENAVIIKWKEIPQDYIQNLIR